MTGFIKRNLLWLIGLAVAIVACIFLMILLTNQRNEYKLAQSENEQLSQELSMQIEKQEKDIIELDRVIENLNKEANGLRDKINADEIQSQYDVIIIDRSLPQDLLNTVFMYYKSINDKDFEMYKSVIDPDNSEQNFMLSEYENRWKTQNARPNEAEGLKNIISMGSNANNFDDINKNSFEGNVTLFVNMSLSNGEYLYLKKENGKWYVWNWD